MSYFVDYFEESARVISHCSQLAQICEEVSEALWNSLKLGGTIYWFGNGGSASDAEHLAAELAGKFKVNRRPVASISLTTNTSLITAIGNDFGFSSIFERQIEALVSKNDAAIGITTSGRSENVLKALQMANLKGALTVAFSGARGIEYPDTDYLIQVPSDTTSHVQEAHIMLGQAICGFLEAKIVDAERI